MKIVCSHSIKQKEFSKGLSNVDLKIIIDSYSKGIFREIKGKNLPKASKIIKIYATTIKGAR